MHSGQWASPYGSNGQPWAGPEGPNGQMTMMLHNCRVRQFHRTSNGENSSSNFRDMCSGPRASPYGSNEHVPITLRNYRSRQFQRASNEKKNCPAVSDICMPKCLDPADARFKKFFSLCQAHWANDMALHNCGSRQFHRTLNGVNPPSGFRDMHFDPWASPYGLNRQMPMTLHN